MAEAAGWNRRRGLSLLEVLIAFAILVILVLPFSLSFITSDRLGYAAGRQVEGVVKGQVLLEAIEALRPEEMPAPGALLDDGGATVGGGEFRWRELVTYFQTSRDPMLRRIVTTEALDQGVVGVTVEVQWLRHPAHPTGEARVQLYGSVQPWLWR